MNEPSTKRWYLVYSKPRQEPVAKRHLERQGYEIYLPRVREVRRRLGRRVSVVAPMFPRYLFIHLDRSLDDWGPIRSTVGVSSLVRFGQQPVGVPDGLIAALREREDTHGLQVAPEQRYRPGTPVRITEGSLIGYEGIFVAHNGRDRVTVLLEILGRSTRSVIDAASITPAR